MPLQTLRRTVRRFSSRAISAISTFRAVGFLRIRLPALEKIYSIPACITVRIHRDTAAHRQWTVSSMPSAFRSFKGSAAPSSFCRPGGFSRAACAAAYVSKHTAIPSSLTTKSRAEPLFLPSRDFFSVPLAQRRLLCYDNYTLAAGFLPARHPLP